MQPFCFPFRNVSLFLLLLYMLEWLFLQVLKQQISPLTLQLSKIVLIIIKDWMEKGSYFSFSSQWESQQVSSAYGPCRKWAVGPLRTPACQPPFVPPTSSCHVTRRQIPPPLHMPLKVASVEGSKLHIKTWAYDWQQFIHPPPVAALRKHSGVKEITAFRSSLFIPGVMGRAEVNINISDGMAPLDLIKPIPMESLVSHRMVEARKIFLFTWSFSTLQFWWDQSVSAFFPLLP